MSWSASAAAASTTPNPYAQVHSIAAVSSLSPAAPTREMSTDTAGASRSIGRVVGPSNTPARLPVHSRSRVKIRSAARSWNAAGVSVRAAARTVSGPFSRTSRTSVMVGCAAGDRSTSRSMARPRMTSSALVMAVPRTRVHRAISSDSRRDRTSQRSAWASGPDMRRSAAPSGPASSGLILSSPRPIRITCPPRCSVSMV